MPAPWQSKELKIPIKIQTPFPQSGIQSVRDQTPPEVGSERSEVVDMAWLRRFQGVPTGYKPDSTLSSRADEASRKEKNKSTILIVSKKLKQELISIFRSKNI